MSDLVSKQDVFNTLKKVGICSMSAYLFEKIWASIEALPSAEPERKWIPCNARMPEEREWLGTKRFGTTISDEVYVTFENPKGERFCKHLSFQNGKLSRFDESTIDAFYPESKPIAWMPLPEPWGGER